MVVYDSLGRGSSFLSLVAYSSWMGADYIVCSWAYRVGNQNNVKVLRIGAVGENNGIVLLYVIEVCQAALKTLAAKKNQ